MQRYFLQGFMPLFSQIVFHKNEKLIKVATCWRMRVNKTVLSACFSSKSYKVMLTTLSREIAFNN